MADVIFVAVICAFFALCVVYVRWCDRIIGPDVTSSTVDAGEPDRVADRDANRDANVSTPTVGVSA